MQRFLFLLMPLLVACTERATQPPPSVFTPASPVTPNPAAESLAADLATVEGAHMTDESVSAQGLATFGAGCFWCVEAVLEQVDGVLDVSSGYMGGESENPTYKEICTGRTGHAEVVQVRFDPARISYGELLEWFFRLHDPTTLNRQGADVGTQYRSAVFYHSQAQEAAARTAIRTLETDKVFADPIVTEVVPASAFYPAEDYHQDYYRLNKEQGYCRMVIAPKLGKLGLER